MRVFLTILEGPSFGHLPSTTVPVDVPGSFQSVISPADKRSRRFMWACFCS